MTLLVNGTPIATDSEGYLKHLSDWSPAVAEQLARAEQRPLTEEHWEIIHLLRRFYQTYQIAPAMRVLVKAVREELGPEKGKSIHLMKLFGESPAKLACKLAGLPKPTNCL